VEYEWISTGGITRSVSRAGMCFAPIDPQPKRDVEVIVGFLRQKHAGVLILSDELFERAASPDVMGSELLFHGWPVDPLFRHIAPPLMR
jgi:hypothetical protein